jgi:peptidase M1-like protein
VQKRRWRAVWSVSIGLLLGALLLARPVAAQGRPASGPQNDVASYGLEARYEPASHQIAGFERIVYRNPSPDPLNELWFHLYLNAFRGPDTLWLAESGRGHRDNAFDPRQPGWTRVEALNLADGTPLRLEPADPDQTIGRVALPSALAPGQSLTLELRWTAQLPRVFARTGTFHDFVMAGQWYPKLAVYDRGGWDRERWHANAEFFADFGNYDLALTVPAGYQTGASGLRLDQVDHDDSSVTVRYRAERVTDVAWTAWPSFARLERTIAAAGQPVELELLLPPGELTEAERYLAAAEAALDSFGRWYGAYPWPKLTVVVPPTGAAGAGGMEYPTLVTSLGVLPLPLGLNDRVHWIELVTVHEIAHQWFPMQVQSNDAAEPWLDEGFADYLTIRLLDRLYGRSSSLFDLPFGRLGYGESLRGRFLTSDVRQPLAQPAWAFSPAGYGATIYAKGSLTLLTLEQQLGEARFTAALHSYADRWRWRHPTIADLQAELEAATGQRLDAVFDGLVAGSGVVEYALAGDPRQPLVERRGEVSLPVELRLNLANGAQRIERWEAGEVQRHFGAAGETVRAAQLDPAERLPLELHRLDDGWSAEPDSGAATTLAIHFQALAQALLLLFGAIG